MKKIIFALIIVLISTVTVGCTSAVYKESLSVGNKAMEDERFAEAIVAYQKALLEKPNDNELIDKIEEARGKYASGLTNVISEITQQAAMAEEMVSGYSSVWNAVFSHTLQKSSFAATLGVGINDVDKYAELDYSGYVAFKGNFENALKNTYNVYEGIGKNEELKSERDKISVKMKELQNPPKEYKEAYDSLVDVYGLYEEYISFALSPSGSLRTYNQKANDLASELVTNIKVFQIKIPE